MPDSFSLFFRYYSVRTLGNDIIRISALPQNILTLLSSVIFENPIEIVDPKKASNTFVK